MEKLIFKKKSSFIIWSIIIVNTFIFNGALPLWDQDESAYAGFASRMLDTGNWLIPEFTWSEIHRKPPLHFWNITLSYIIFGINEFSVRCSSSLFTLGTYFLIYDFTKHFYKSKKIALLSVIVLSTSFLVSVLAKIAVTDATLLFFSTLSAISLIRYMNNGKFYWVLLLWIGVSFALLTKGPPIIIFLGVFSLLFLIFDQKRWRLLNTHPWFFFPIALIPLFYWGYLAYQSDNGKLINWMIDWYILKRVGGSVLGQSAPPGVHLIFIGVFFLLYASFFKHLTQYIKKIWTVNKSEKVLLFWFFAGWFIYELTPSKLPAYVIAAHPPLAILLAKVIFDIYQEKASKPFIYSIQMVIYNVLGIAIMVLPFIFLHTTIIDKTLFVIAGLSLCVFSFYLLKKKEIKLLIMGNFLLLTIIWTTLFPRIEFITGGNKKFSQFIQKNVKENSTLYFAHIYSKEASIPFYIGKKYKIIRDEHLHNNVQRLRKEENIYVLFSDQQLEKIKSTTNLDGFKIKRFGFRLSYFNKEKHYNLITKK